MVGYRLRIKQCDIGLTADGDTAVTLHWTNDGIAPFYFDWQPALALIDENGNATILPVDLQLIDVLPGRTVLSETLLPALNTENGEYTLRVGIIDPSTGQAGIALAMDHRSDGFLV